MQNQLAAKGAKKGRRVRAPREMAPIDHAPLIAPVINSGLLLQSSPLTCQCLRVCVCVWRGREIPGIHPRSYNVTIVYVVLIIPSIPTYWNYQPLHWSKSKHDKIASQPNGEHIWIFWTYRLLACEWLKTLLRKGKLPWSCRGVERRHGMAKELTPRWKLHFQRVAFPFVIAVVPSWQRRLL